MRLAGAMGAVLLLAGCVNPDTIDRYPGDRPVSSRPVIVAPSPGTGPVARPGGGMDRPTSTDAVARGVSGRVSDRRGRAISGAFVQASGAASNRFPVPERAVVTDRQGHYEWFLQPGDYTLTVSASGYAPQSRRVTVRRNGGAVLDFVLR